jgi:hypothetical protein
VTTSARNSIAIAAAVTAAAIALLPSAARATTEPEVIVPLGVRLTDAQVALSETHVDRGSIVKLTVLNASGASRAFAIAGRQSKVLKAKSGKQIFFMTFDTRGDYTYRSWSPTKKSAKVLTGVFHVV